MLRVQRWVPRVPPRVLGPALRAMSTNAFVRWSFNHYMNVADPLFVYAGEPDAEPVAA